MSNTRIALLAVAAVVLGIALGVSGAGRQPATPPAGTPRAIPGPGVSAPSHVLRYSTIHEAAGAGDVADVRKHLARGEALEALAPWGQLQQTMTPLAVAASEGRLEVMRFLIAAGADVNARGGLPLYLAAGGGGIDAVELLLSSGAPINDAQGNCEALIAVAAGSNVPLLRVLLARGANPNSFYAIDQTCSPLWIAIRNRQAGTAQVLRQYGAKEPTHPIW